MGGRHTSPAARSGRRAASTSIIAAGVAGAWWLDTHRRSRAVQAWRPSAHGTETSGGLAAKVFGNGSHTVLLLHGLGATSEFWGAAYDRLGDHHRVLAPDLLGFGDSLDEAGADFGLDRHLAALDQLVTEHAPGSQQITVVAHSMGCALALAWAARHHDRVEQVICVGAPMFANEKDARGAIGHAGPMARIFLLDRIWAERACALSCAYRGLAGWLATAIDPGVPVPMARRSPLHTWPAYRDAMQDLILEAPWRRLLSDLAGHDVPTALTWGDRDPLGDPEFVRSVLGDRSQRFVVVPGADHHLPITHSKVVIEQIGAGASTNR